MKSNILISTDNHFPYFGNGIEFKEHLFGLEFDANLIHKTSELIWKPNSTLPFTPLKKLPSPYTILSDIALEMTVQNDSKIGLIGQNALLKEVKLIDDGLMDKFILKVQSHILNPTKESAQLIADVRCWCSWLANGIKIEPIFNGKNAACAFIPWPLSGLLLLSSRIIGQQPEFEYAADYVLRSGILPDQELDNYDDVKKNVDYIRSIKPVVAFHDFDGNEQGFRMTHLAMERTSNMMIGNALLAVKNKNIKENLEKIELATKQSNQLFNAMWKVSEPSLYNKEVRIFIQGLFGNQGGMYPEKGLFFENCGEDFDNDYNSKGCYLSNLHGQTGANSSYHPIADEITGVGDHTHAYIADNIIDKAMIKGVLEKGFVSSEDLPNNIEVDSLTKLLKSFRVGYRPPAHHAMIVKTRNAIQNSNYFSKIESNIENKKILASAVRWIIQHRIDHYKMVVFYILKAPDPYRNQTKSTGTGGSPTPTFLPKMFTHSIDRLKNLVGSENISWANDLVDITSSHETAMKKFQNIAMKSKN